MADTKKRHRLRKQQQNQFDLFFQSFSSSAEAQQATQQGLLSTDRKFTRKVLHQLALANEQKQAAEEERKYQEYVQTCRLAGLSPPPSPSKRAKTPGTAKKKTLKERQAQEQQAAAVAQLLEKKAAVLPWPFDDLLLLQNYDGRWLDVDQIYHCLGIPPSSYFANGDLAGPTPHPWEQATALAIAKMRQRYDLFESLGDAHDRALPWLQTKGILNLASEIISFCLQRGFGKAPPVLVPELQQEEEGGRASLAAPVDPYLQLMSASSITNYARVKHQEALRHEKLAATEGIAQKQVADARREVALVCLVDSVNYSKMISKVQDLQRDCEVFENKCVAQMTFVDKLRKELKQCLDRCVARYKSCRLHAERNDAFLELQASLADDVPGRVGFTGWEAEGKHGYRTAVISLLTSLHSLGQARLVLREVLLTGVQIDREVTARSFEAQEFYFLVKRLLEKLPPTAEPADMFYLSWNGQDMMKYLYSSLDFLHQCSLLLDWFGTAYPWFGNPIAFCIPLEHLCAPSAADPRSDTMGTGTVKTHKQRYSLLSPSKVETFLENCDYNAKHACRYLYSSQAHVTGTRPVVDMAKDAEHARREDRRQRDDVLRCQEQLDEAMTGLPGWWPKGLELSDLNRVQILLTALLTLRVTTREYAKSNRHTLREEREEDEQGGGDLRKSATAPGRIPTTGLIASPTATGTSTVTHSLPGADTNRDTDKNSNNDTCNLRVSAHATTSNPHSTVPPDFKTWLFCDDWYDDHHSRPEVVAKKLRDERKRLKAAKKRGAYVVPTRPGNALGSTASAGASGIGGSAGVGGAVKERPKSASATGKREKVKRKSVSAKEKKNEQQEKEQEQEQEQEQQEQEGDKKTVELTNNSTAAGEGEGEGEGRRGGVLGQGKRSNRGGGQVNASSTLQSKRRSDELVKGSDIGGDIFSALDSPNPSSSSLSQQGVGKSVEEEGGEGRGEEVGKGDGEGEEGGRQHRGGRMAVGDDDLLLTQNTHDQEEEEEEEGGVIGGGSFFDSVSGGGESLVESMVREGGVGGVEREEVEKKGEENGHLRPQPQHLEREDPAPSPSPQLHPPPHLAPRPVVLNTPDHSKNRGDRDGDRDGMRERERTEEDDASVASIESLSQAVKNQNLMHVDPADRAQDSKGASVSAEDILGGGEGVTKAVSKKVSGRASTAGRNTSHVSKKTTSTTTPSAVVVTGKASTATTTTRTKTAEGSSGSNGDQKEKEKEDQATPVPAAPAAALSEKELAKKEKDRKRRRKNTVSERLEAARRGRGGGAGSSLDADGNELPVIVKRDTVSRAAPQPRNMTRRANNPGALVSMPPVAHSSKPRDTPARRGNI